ncbi:cobalamin-independent methionine synthase II family protein [Glycomyces endophyticus]|uniref:Cobalamin-independent methionine synthase II family protein n=1 Tax=Glycomyces endophyticus TaxID=480996 RepID=A0ABN2HK19_9ACTN
MADDNRFHIDHHGSLPRPGEILEARRRYEAGAIDYGELRELEDENIAELLAWQWMTRSTVVTDGDWRREDLRSAVFDHVRGFKETTETDRWGRTRWTADGDLAAESPLAADDADFLLANTEIAVKTTLPSPAWIAEQTYEPGGHWSSARALGDALAELVHAEIKRCLAKGVRLVQLDNPAYAKHLFGREPVLSLADAVAIDAAAVTGLDRPDDARVGLCPTHSAADGLDLDAARALFTGVPVDRWILPYSTGSDTEFALFDAVPEDRDVCLGVVDATDPALEDVDTLLSRVDRAAAKHGEDRLAFSPSQGFAPAAGRDLLTLEQARQKMVLVEVLSRYYWGNEF